MCNALDTLMSRYKSPLRLYIESAFYAVTLKCVTLLIPFVVDL